MLGEIWRPATTSELSYLNISKQLSMHCNLRNESVIFWEEIYRSMSLKSNWFLSQSYPMKLNMGHPNYTTNHTQPIHRLCARKLYLIYTWYSENITSSSYYKQWPWLLLLKNLERVCIDPVFLHPQVLQLCKKELWNLLSAMENTEHTSCTQLIYCRKHMELQTINYIFCVSTGRLIS